MTVEVKSRMKLDVAVRTCRPSTPLPSRQFSQLESLLLHLRTERGSNTVLQWFACVDIEVRVVVELDP